MNRLARSLFAAAGAIAIAAIGCGDAKSPTQGGNVDAARRTGQRSNDGEVVGLWLLAELVSLRRSIVVGFSNCTRSSGRYRKKK